ncbi:uncharacterized protein A4U43_C09F14300 [Asparagus officinalis]|uniref:CRC domain-containing protein n=1 Tax=Asparagus officinalis TaxID=4686 RepID=A0A5P1EAT2_ASPOF|nr:protein tesmin/TSO1-like CXC 2 isoform X2 [Asparagus officinalis]ONK58557.1 uncharacterized protein A4U43_C09F14300 [Asparagus officinalis]
MRTTDSYAATRGFGRLFGGFNSHEGRTGAGSRSNRDNGNALRSCTCEKSQCWKLYCDCFTNNYYCGKSCSCDGCWNSIDKEDSVRAAREHIESRDSGGKKIASSSGMQTKGCNCMKSHCQKKYCECYNAGNGCSLNCRCAGCQNSYGKRQGTEPVIQSVSKRGRKPKNSIDVRILIENSKTIDHQPIQSSMENGQIVLNHDNQLPCIVPETRERQTSQETMILSRVMPEANENVSLLEAQYAAGSSSAQSELIQGSSDHSDEYMHASKPNTPN